MRDVDGRRIYSHIRLEDAIEEVSNDVSYHPLTYRYDIQDRLRDEGIYASDSEVRHAMSRLTRRGRCERCVRIVDKEVEE